MKLSVLERIELSGLLPKESNYITFRILLDLQRKLSFTEKEIIDFKIVQRAIPNPITGQLNNQINWGKSIDKEIPIGEQAKIIIQAALKKIDADGKVNAENIFLFDKFLPEIEIEVSAKEIKK